MSAIATMPKCSCKTAAPAPFSFFWPGSAPRVACVDCTMRGMNIARVIGFELQWDLTDEGKRAKQLAEQGSTGPDRFSLLEVS